jgi:hypothetical protein
MLSISVLIPSSSLIRYSGSVVIELSLLFSNFLLSLSNEEVDFGAYLAIKQSQANLQFPSG